MLTVAATVTSILDALAAVWSWVARHTIKRRKHKHPKKRRKHHG